MCNYKKCENYKKYKESGKKYCLICLIEIKDSDEKIAEKNESKETFFKHASEDL